MTIALTLKYQTPMPTYMHTFWILPGGEIPLQGDTESLAQLPSVTRQTYLAQPCACGNCKTTTKINPTAVLRNSSITSITGNCFKKWFVVIICIYQRPLVITIQLGLMCADSSTHQLQNIKKYTHITRHCDLKTELASELNN